MPKKFEHPPIDQEDLPFWYSRIADSLVPMEVHTVTWDPASVAANTTAEQTVTVTGVVVGNSTILGDAVVGVSKPSHQAGLGIAGYRVSADDTIALTFMNTTGSAIDPSYEQYIITIAKAVI